MEKGSIKLSSKDKPSFGVKLEGFSIIAEVFCKGF